MKNNKILQYLKWLWIVAVVVFVGYYFYKHLPEVTGYLKEMEWFRLVGALVLILISKLFFVEMARQSVTRDTWKPSYIQMFSIVTVSQLGKYIPGSIWQFAARVSSYKENALSNKKTAKVMIMENAWLVSGALAFGLLMLSIQPPFDLFKGLIQFEIPALVWKILPFILFLIWVGGLLLLDAIFPAESKKFSFKRTAWLIIAQTCSWASIGFSFFLIFSNLSSHYLLQIIGGYAISWIAGFIFIFAPSGIGVREFVLVTLFSSFLPAEQIAAFSVVHRLIYTIADVLLGTGGFALQKKFATAEKAMQEATQPETVPLDPQNDRAS